MVVEQKRNVDFRPHIVDGKCDNGNRFTVFNSLDK